MKKNLGQCLCGIVQYEFKADQLLAYQCHCSTCQRVTGTAFSTTLFANEKSFKWINGESKINTYTRESGYIIQFCAICSSPVPNKFRHYPLYSIPAGGLKQGFNIKIAVQLCLDSKAAWDTEQYSGMQYQNIPALEEIFQLLHL